MATSPESISPEATHPAPYRGRVRSGCLTCRSRKVKCDEQRPICHNCSRLKRICVYKPRQTRQHNNDYVNHGKAPVSPASFGFSGDAVSSGKHSASPTLQTPLSEYHFEVPVVDAANHQQSSTENQLESTHNPFQHPDEEIVAVTSRLERALQRQRIGAATDHDDFDQNSPSVLISRDIELTTTMDILAAGEISYEPSFSYFIDRVELPAITIYDSVNWAEMKLRVVQMGFSNPAITLAIISVSMVQKALLHSIPLSKAMSMYHSAKSAFNELVEDDSKDFDAILVAAFLLCLFDLINYDMSPILAAPCPRLVQRFETWSLSDPSLHSSLSLRIILWMRLLRTIAFRGGGRALISESICNLFPSIHASGANTSSLASPSADASSHLYEMLSTPLFEFYLELQIISGDTARLTHYHRSRTRGADQEEVAAHIARIKLRLLRLWEGRPATLRQNPEDIRSNLAPKVADPIISMAGVCSAAYHAEFIEIGRLLGDPVTENTDSKQAMVEVRKIIQGDWNVYQDGKLNAGYLRPLFLYVIECMDRDASQWAVAKLRQIKNIVCRSDFFATFGEELANAELRKERRVTSKYFCIWYFGVPPPYL
ncbi:hypothetical protein NQ176_g8177 [Zarea fungicola]|uniref:Uncharacterized protein n=1 Tax=Zarea fungicola TaxID=93591 RepID=A0ACC1MVR9_9HYPO|nr:hypothetical protein NQ176_g8177 [Lecanicillium fungicola]